MDRLADNNDTGEGDRMGDTRETKLDKVWKVLKVLALVIVVLGAPGG